MISQIAFKDVLGLPLVAWGGLLTFLVMVLTFLSGALNRRGIHIIPLKYHFPLAWAAMALAIFHGLIGLLAVMGY